MDELVSDVVKAGAASSQTKHDGVGQSPPKSRLGRRPVEVPRAEMLEMLDLVPPGGGGLYAAATIVIQRRYPDLNKTQQEARQRRLVRRFRAERDQLLEGQRVKAASCRAPAVRPTLSEMQAALSRSQHFPASPHTSAVWAQLDEMRRAQVRVLADFGPAERLAGDPVVLQLAIDERRLRAAAVDLEKGVTEQMRNFEPFLTPLSSPNSVASAFPEFHTSVVRQLRALEATLRARVGSVANVLPLGGRTR